MRPAQSRVLALALQLATVYAQENYGKINHDAQPYVIAMVNNASVGPDGPWWYISQAVDYPDQFVPMMPSISQTSLTVNDSACRTQQASCPLPLPNMWTVSGAYKVDDGPIMQSNLIDAKTWDPDYAALLDMSGSGRHFTDRMTLHRDSDSADPVFLSIGMGISANYTVNYGADAGYTMDVGFMSLNGAQETIEWEATNGTQVNRTLTLAQAYNMGASPSLSYGLHIGSVEPNITGSLVLGGYDSSRCLTDPIISNGDIVQLKAIALNVSSGGYAWESADAANISSLLLDDGAVIDDVTVHLRPGVPHMYLPDNTCNAIAAHLPVTWDSDHELYFWDTEKQAYKDIISSPHHLSFTFASDNGPDSTINVPFALLNLTLSSPIISSPTQYFPCKGWKPDTTGYTLGNAFLQAAFLAQNWKVNKTFLAQAPGPDFLSSSVQKIAFEDVALTAARNPPSWEDSWSSTLKPLPATSSGSSSVDGLPTGDSSSGISGGAIAGIVVGVVGGLAIVAAIAWFLTRRRKRNQGPSHLTAPQDPDTPLPQYHDHDSGVPYLGKPAMAPVEVEAQQSQVSEMWSGQDVAELPAANKVQEKPAVYS